MKTAILVFTMVLFLGRIEPVVDFQFDTRGEIEMQEDDGGKWVPPGV